MIQERTMEMKRRIRITITNRSEFVIVFLILISSPFTP
jgi:hypothetical protein